MIVVGVALAWAGSPSSQGVAQLAIPTFAADPSAADAARAGVKPRATLLPTDCADTLTGPVDVAALLGQPTGSVTGHTVRGVGSPSVGLLERVNCTYSVARRPAPLLTVGLGAFADPASAARQRDRNLAAEQGDARSSVVVPLGDARAVLVTERDRRLLMVAYDRFTLTAALASGVVAESQVQPVLTDFARRVLPTLEPAAVPQPANPSRR
jgi:hypothetical protein